MKKLLFVFLAGTLLLGLCACGQKETAPTWQEQYDLGIRYLSEGNYEEAIIAFTAAIEIDPKQAEAYIGRGDAYLAGGETAETLEAARNDYALAIELDGVNAGAYLRLADIYTRQGDDEAAMTLLQQALERMGEDSDIAAALEQLAQKLAANAIPEIGPAVEPLPAARTEERYGGEVVEYDANDRLIRSFIRLDNGTLYWEKFYLYDAVGLLASTREIQYALHVSGNPPEEYVDCEFDGLGRLIKRVDQDIQLGEDVTFVGTTTYHYNGTQVEVTIDGSEPETDIPTWHWSVSYDMSDPLHAVQTGNRGYGYYVELTEYDWVDADPVINFFGGTVKQSAYDGNSNQLPWSENWYFGVDQHPEWRYQP